MAINASLRLLIVTVVTSHSVMKSSPATIAAPTPPAYRTEAMTLLSRVPEVRCWTSQIRVRVEDVTQTMIQASICII